MGSGNGKNKDEWSFDISEEYTATESERIKVDASVFDDTNTSVRNLKAKLSTRGNKAKGSSKYKPMRLDHATRGPKKSRRAVAREMNIKKTATDLFKQRYATLSQRLFAGTVDLLMVLGIVFFSQFFSPLLNEILDEFLFLAADIEFLTPELIQQYSWIGLSVIGILLFYTIPSALYGRSLGKNLMNLYIGKEDKVAHKASFFQCFFREVIFKPISILSVFGILMILVNADHRSLHDRLSGTSILKV